MTAVVVAVLLEVLLVVFLGIEEVLELLHLRYYLRFEVLLAVFDEFPDYWLVSLVNKVDAVPILCSMVRALIIETRRVNDTVELVQYLLKRYNGAVVVNFDRLSCVCDAFADFFIGHRLVRVRVGIATLRANNTFQAKEKVLNAPEATASEVDCGFLGHSK